jgi:hypothetical protein
MAARDSLTDTPLAAIHEPLALAIPVERDESVARALANHRCAVRAGGSSGTVWERFPSHEHMFACRQDDMLARNAQLDAPPGDRTQTAGLKDRNSDQLS